MCTLPFYSTIYIHCVLIKFYILSYIYLFSSACQLCTDSTSVIFVNENKNENKKDEQFVDESGNWN